MGRVVEKLIQKHRESFTNVLLLPGVQYNILYCSHI